MSSTAPSGFGSSSNPVGTFSTEQKAQTHPPGNLFLCNEIEQPDRPMDS